MIRSEHFRDSSGGFACHVSFSKRTVRMFERNIGWLNIAVGDSFLTLITYNVSNTKNCTTCSTRWNVKRATTDSFSNFAADAAKKNSASCGSWRESWIKYSSDHFQVSIRTQVQIRVRIVLMSSIFNKCSLICWKNHSKSRQVRFRILPRATIHMHVHGWKESKRVWAQVGKTSVL